MNQSVTYRQNAAACYEAARILSDPRQKAKLLAMAQSWISLADLAARNSHLDLTQQALGLALRKSDWANALERLAHADGAVLPYHRVLRFHEWLSFCNHRSQIVVLASDLRSLYRVVGKRRVRTADRHAAFC